ncbi:hypothetical protein NL108_016257 [Boleophthalmus pectinirostris]|nr:hypothetical protein NL108_016257 [Boleophthalmus pectinirostris]
MTERTTEKPVCFLPFDINAFVSIWNYYFRVNSEENILIQNCFLCFMSNFSFRSSVSSSHPSVSFVLVTRRSSCVCKRRPLIFLFLSSSSSSLLLPPLFFFFFFLLSSSSSRLQLLLIDS